MRDWQPALIVVGLPYNVDDSESALTAAARRFARELAERYAVPVELIDERYSSLEAETRLKAAARAGIAQAARGEGRRRCGGCVHHLGAMVH